MKTAFLTIALDAMPFIAWHYGEMRKLDFDWTWHVVEGVAAPEHCTSWCSAISPGLSSDGTKQYLDGIAEFDSRVRLYRNAWWHGKIEMVNAPLKAMQDACLLVEIDSDEIWSAEQLAKIREMFMRDPRKNAALFKCRYFVGPDVVVESKRNCWGGWSETEWRRAWRWQPGRMFKTHEPPELDAFQARYFTHEETEERGLVFDHFAYATQAQIGFKARYYAGALNPNAEAYKRLSERWQALQRNRQWPVELKNYFPFVQDGVVAKRIKREASIK